MKRIRERGIKGHSLVSSFNRVGSNVITKVGECWRKSWDVYDWCPFTDSYLSVVSVLKNPPASAGDAGDVGSIPGSGRSPGGGNGNPLQYSGRIP